MFNNTKRVFMKLFGIGGLGTGKLGNQVFAVRSGEQIVRQYNPVVSNPQTAKQVETRAKLKLASQLAAVVAPAIAIPADGLKTKRNEFISRNYPSLTYQNDEAQMAMDQLSLTKGVAYLPSITATRDNSTEEINVQLGDVVNDIYDYVVYCVVEKETDGSLMLVQQEQVTITQSTGLAQATLDAWEGTCYIYAYGIRANSDESRAKYNELLSEGAADVVKLATSRDATLSNVTFSRTRYAKVTAI